MKGTFYRKLAVALAIALAPAPALADDPQTADEWFKKGEEEYNLGNFKAAINAFQEAFKRETNESRRPAYVFNIAVAYQQNGNCRKAQFQFKRFLDLKAKDTVKPLTPALRENVEGRIRSLDECAQKEPAEQLDTPDTTKPVEVQKPVEVAVKPVETPVVEEPALTAQHTGTGPQLVSARLVGGASIISAGDLNVPVQATFALLAGYPIAVGEKLTVEAGAGFSFTPVPFRNMITNEDGSAAFTTVVANAGITYQAIEKLGIRADVGAGILAFSGASESPFTRGAPTTGALVMPHVRIGLSADYTVAPNLVATATPFAFTYSPPKDGMREEITALTAINMMIGLGYRM